MDMNRLARGQTERVRPDRLDALLVGPGLDGLFDIGFDADSSAPNRSFCSAMARPAIGEEPGHRRQVLLEIALVDELERGRLG